MTSLCIVYAGWDPNWFKAFLGVMLLLALVSKVRPLRPHNGRPHHVWATISGRE